MKYVHFGAEYFLGETWKTEKVGDIIKMEIAIKDMHRIELVHYYGAKWQTWCAQLKL
jgi:hypothetical protein